MDVMPLVPETKMAGVSILISLGNLLVKRTAWLVLKTTSATSIFSRVFGAYYVTWIFYKYSNLPTLTLFSQFHLESQHSSLSHFHLQGQYALSSVTSRENTLTLSISTNRVNTLFLFLHFTSDTKMYTPCNHSLSCYTLSVRLFPASNTEISSNHRNKQTVEILSQHT